MNRVTKSIAEWQKAVDQYKIQSEKIQKRITRSLRTIWLQSEKYKKCEVQKMINDAGRTLFYLRKNLNI